MAASLVELSRRCGKAGCRWATGDLHAPYVYLSMGAASASVRQVLGEISAINLELLARRERATQRDRAAVIYVR